MLRLMASPAETDAPAHAQRDTDSAWGAKFALGVVGFVMLVEFALPGFLAAGFSRTGKGFVSVNRNGWGSFNVDGDPLPPRLRVEQALLAPADWLMNYSRPIHRFYMWQYRLAGGVEVMIPLTE
jgi:hypothetical protein